MDHALHSTKHFWHTHAQILHIEMRILKPQGTSHIHICPDPLLSRLARTTGGTFRALSEPKAMTQVTAGELAATQPVHTIITNKIISYICTKIMHIHMLIHTHAFVWVRSILPKNKLPVCPVGCGELRACKHSFPANLHVCVCLAVHAGFGQTCASVIWSSHVVLHGATSSRQRWQPHLAGTPIHVGSALSPPTPRKWCSKRLMDGAIHYS